MEPSALISFIDIMPPGSVWRDIAIRELKVIEQIGEYAKLYRPERRSPRFCKNQWTQWQIFYLLEHWRRMNKYQLLKQLGRSSGACEHKFCRLASPELKNYLDKYYLGFNLRKQYHGKTLPKAPLM